MDAMEANKIAAAILGGGLVFMLAGFIANAVVSPVELSKPAFAVKATETAAAPAAKPAPVPLIIPLLAKANVKAGEKYVSTVCAACHNYTKGQGAKIGPDLYDMVGAKRFATPGFNFSNAVKKLSGNNDVLAGTTWTYADLNLWLHDPQKVAPGTRMTFAGIKNTAQRADVIAFLRTLSPKPAPLPTSADVTKAEAEYAAATKAAKAPPPAAKAAAKPAAAPSGVPAIAPLLASANVKVGQKYVEQVCAVCHNYTKGQGAKIGPDLYDMVGAKRFATPGFDFSDAVKKLRGNNDVLAGTTWTYADLNLWLHDPQKVAPGTRMSFPGIKNTHQRADVIAFLRTLSAQPVPLPKAAPASAAAVKAVPAASPPAGTTKVTPPAASAPVPAAPAKPAAAPSGVPAIAPLLASANVKVGKQYVEQVCAVCHNYAKGAGAKIGPDLYDMVGAKRFATPGFNFSDAVKKLRGNNDVLAGTTWTYANLNLWLHDPQKVAPGTRMSFPGIKNIHQRADVIAFLRTLSAQPVPLPGAATPAGH